MISFYKIIIKLLQNYNLVSIKFQYLVFSINSTLFNVLMRFTVYEFREMFQVYRNDIDHIRP